MQPKAFFQTLLEQADIKVGGNRPWDVQIHDERLYTRVLRHGALGLGEAYMDGWWDAGDLDGAIYRALAADFRDNMKVDLGVIVETALSWERRLAEVETPDIKDLRRRLASGF